MLWGVVKLHTAQELSGYTAAQYVVKALSEVRVQVVEHQVNPARFGVCASEQFFDEGDEVNFSSTLCDRDDSLPTFGLDRYEQIPPVPE